MAGPGIITSNVDNDAGGIATYSMAGSHFGYSLLWSLIPIMVALIIVQEMSARMGVVTGKGLSDLIRERFGVKVTVYVLIGVVLTNFGNVIAEFAGIASSLEIFHVSKYVSVPAERRPRLAARRQGDLPVGGEDLPLRLPVLRHLHRLRVPGQAGLGGDREEPRPARASTSPRARWG